MDTELGRLPVKRRTFLKGIAATGTGAVLPSLLSGLAFAATDGVLQVRSHGDMSTVDPAKALGLIDEVVHGPIFSKLIQFKPGDTWDWQLDAASMIEQVDPTHIKFALRDDVGFTDGFGAMTAKDVKFSIERIVDPEVGSPNSIVWAALDHVEVTGEREGVIVLKTPFDPIWKTALPYIAGNIVSKAAVESVGGIMENMPVAQSGPYLLTEWNRKEKITLTPNPDWNGEKPVWDRIEVLPIDDETTAEIAFEAGELDFTRISIGSVPRFREEVPNGGTLLENPSNFYVWVGMNMAHPKLQNKKLRQAIQHAIDIPTILEAAYFDVPAPSGGIVPSSLPGSREKTLVPPEANLEKAAALLAESGETNVSLRLDTLNKTTFNTIAQIVQANLSQIGITVEVNSLEPGSFWSSGKNEDLQIFLNRYSMAPDPYDAVVWFKSEEIGNWNWEHFASEEFDEIVETVAGIEDDEERAAMYRRAQDIMEETGAYRFITNEVTPVVHAAGVNPTLRPDGEPLLRYFGKS